MTQCRDIENSHHEHLSDIALQMLEKFVKNQLTEDLHDELRIVREIHDHPICMHMVHQAY